MAVAVDFMQNIRTFGQKFLYLTFLKVLMLHHVQKFLYLTFFKVSESSYATSWPLG